MAAKQLLPMSVAAVRRLMERPAQQASHHRTAASVHIWFWANWIEAQALLDRGAPEEDLTPERRFVLDNFEGVDR